ncbi:hypothetical protein F8M41_016364, partial [Gigaspora margarita]
ASMSPWICAVSLTCHTCSQLSPFTFPALHFIFLFFFSSFT